MVKEYIEANQSRFLDELYALLRIPSVSADSRHKGDVRKAAEYVRDRLKELGADVTLVEHAGQWIKAGRETDGRLVEIRLLGQTPERRVAALAAAGDPDAVDVHVRILRGEVAQRGGVVRSHRAAEAAVTGIVKGLAALRRASRIDDDDQIAVLCDPQRHAALRHRRGGEAVVGDSDLAAVRRHLVASGREACASGFTHALLVFTTAGHVAVLPAARLGAGGD